MSPWSTSVKLGMGLSAHEVTPTLVGQGRTTVGQGQGLSKPAWLEDLRSEDLRQRGGVVLRVRLP